VLEGVEQRALLRPDERNGEEQGAEDPLHQRGKSIPAAFNSSTRQARQRHVRPGTGVSGGSSRHQQGRTPASVPQVKVAPQRAQRDRGRGSGSAKGVEIGGSGPILTAGHFSEAEHGQHCTF
jgi:hypothetical protein